MSQEWDGFAPPPTGGFYQPRYQPQFAPRGLPPPGFHQRGPGPRPPPPTGGYYQPRHQPQFAPRGLPQPLPGFHQRGPGPRPPPCFQPPHVPSTLTSPKQGSTQPHTKGNSLTERMQWKKLQKLHAKMKLMNSCMPKDAPDVSYDKVAPSKLQGMARKKFSQLKKQKKLLKRINQLEQNLQKNPKEECDAGGISGQQGGQGPGAKRPVPKDKLNAVEGRAQRNDKLAMKFHQMLHEVLPTSGGETEINYLKHNIELIDRRINHLLIERNGRDPITKCGTCKKERQKRYRVSVDSVMSFLSHCSTNRHVRRLQLTEEQCREVPTDFSDLTPGPQEQQGDFAGSEFVMPCKALYCRLCGQFATNAGCMYMHLRTTAHVNLYKAEYDGSHTSQLLNSAPNIWRLMPK